MKVGFIGLGRMGQGMAGRLLGAGHDLVIYDRIPTLLTALGEAGATVATSVPEVTADREVVIDMLPHDAALESLAFSSNGLLESLPKGAIHMPMGTHGVEIICRLEQAHTEAGQILVAGHVLGRPDLAAAGQLSIVPGGPPESLARLQPLFDVLGKRTFVAGAEPQAATAVKIAHNFVLGCAIEVIGEGMSLARKYRVEPSLFHQVLTEGLFGCPAYKIYGQIIVDEAYDKVGASVQIGIKDANLALAAGEAVGVPLPSCNVMRDRLLGAVSHGDGECDWAVMAREQARASGLE
jgi:3-hydroxyisobutyrate dehydrogenase-like beta-hydroxyacid dehydrogenase